MSRYIRELGAKVWLACGLAMWLVALVGMRASVPAGSTPGPTSSEKPAAIGKASPVAEQGAAAYVGQDTCLGCHDGKQEGYEGSPHSIKSDPRTPAAKQACESCHGPGGRHAQDPPSNPMVRFDKVTPDVANAQCTTCHNRGEHALWDGSQHDSRGVKCADCHSVHSYKSPEKQLKEATQLELCVKCHRDKIAKLDRSGHMPVREGKMTCTSCHNVHGTTNVRLLRKGESAAESCVSCHPDKRGPYLWEHAPVRDGCTTCHDPHGTTNERMLVAKPPLLCQRCHVATRHPSTIYDAAAVGPTSPVPSVRVYGRSCVICHSQIHGSNHPSGQRFVR